MTTQLLDPASGAACYHQSIAQLAHTHVSRTVPHTATKSSERANATAMQDNVLAEEVAQNRKDDAERQRLDAENIRLEQEERILAQQEEEQNEKR